MKNEQSDLAICYIAITDLKPATYNPRKISAPAFEQLKESIRRFQFVDPIIANSAPERKNVVIGGHMRLRAAKELGFETVPVVYVYLPDLAEEKELNLRLNKNTGEWDYDLLKNFELEILTDIGFDQIELASFWDEELNVQEEKFDEEKELKKIKQTDIEPGDLLILGEHKLLCADATDPNALRTLFGDERASMVYSDPIYNIGLDYNKGVGNASDYGGTVNDSKSALEYKEFIRQSLNAAMPITSPDTHYFYWCDEAWVWVFQTLYMELGIKNRRLNIWIKNNASPTPMVAFNKATEYCVYGTTGSPYLSDLVQNATEIMNPEFGVGNELLEDISSLWTAKRLKVREYEHATSKPPTLHDKALKRCTKPGDLILDSFAGSGSTIIAAEQLKRRVYATEIEPVFCELIRRRYEKLTGKTVEVIKGAYEKA